VLILFNSFHVLNQMLVVYRINTFDANQYILQIEIAAI